MDPALELLESDQQRALGSFSSHIAKLFVGGREYTPPTADGMRYFKTNGPVTIKELISKYLSSIPGYDIVMIAKPDFILNDPKELLAFIDKEKYGMTWGCYAPHLFIFSSQLAAHLLSDMPSGITFVGDEWKKWLTDYATSMMRHRFFDASQYNLTTPLYNNPVTTPVVKEVQSLVIPVRKKGNVRKVKLSG